MKIRLEQQGDGKSSEDSGCDLTQTMALGFLAVKAKKDVFQIV